MAMIERKPKHLPVVSDPGSLEERGVTIPVPTPTSIDIPNPWKPSSTNGAAVNQSTPPAPAKGESSDS